MSFTSDVETESRSHDAVETSSDVLERSAKKGTTVPRARAKQSALESARGQNVIGLSSAESEYYALTKGGCSGLGLQRLFADWNLKLQLSLHTETLRARRQWLREEDLARALVINR